MKVSPIFAHFVADETLQIDNKKIEDHCYQLQKNSLGRQISNMGGWQSENLNLTDPLLDELINAIGEKVLQLNTFLGFENVSLNISNAWVNINGRNNFNTPHNHPLSFYSAVYYVNGGVDKGNLVFLNPFNFFDGIMAQNKIKEYGIFNSVDWSFEPITGRLLIFPSWLTHYVKANNTDENRISIAFNFGVINEN